MEVRVLGAHNLQSSETHLVSLLVDGKLALDAGSLASGLSLDEQKAVRAILLTHYHYDHVRDVPAIGLSTAYSPEPIEVCASQVVLEVLAEHLINGELYPDFRQWPPDRPAMRFRILLPHKFYQIIGYEVLSLPVLHKVPTTGYYVKDSYGKSLFYTGDTSKGLSQCWQTVSPNLLIIEVSGPNSLEEKMTESGHMTPEGLRHELLEFRRLKGYLPDVVAIHFIPMMEEQVRTELAEVAKDLKANIHMSGRGMRLTV
jgi:ribonuclease BN (tRNA processing enzyme)